MGYTAHVDTFARDNLPAAEQMPELLFERPEFRYPARMNCAVGAARPDGGERGTASAPSSAR